MMIRLIVLFFTIVCFTCAISELLQIKFEKSLTLNFLLLFLVAFISHLLGGLKYWKIILSILLIASIIYLFLKIRANFILQLLNNKSFYLFAIFYVIIYLICRTKGLSCVDDFYYWGAKVKECVRLNSLYSISDTMIAPDTYHPFMTFLEVLFCKLLGGYSEQTCLFANSLFVFSFFFSFISEKKIANTLLCILYFLVTSLTISSSTMLSDSFVFNCIYVDWPLAIVFAYSLYLVYDFDFKLNSYIYLSLVISILVLIKQAGLFLLIIVLIYLLINHAIHQKRKVNALMILISPVLLYVLWRLNLSYYIVNSSIAPITSKSFSELFSELIHIFNKDNFGSLTIKFFGTCISGRLIDHPFHISYLLITLLQSLSLYIVYKINNNKKVYILACCFFAGSVLYAVGTYITYETVFIEYEVERLTEFARYMQIYSFSGFVLLFYIITSNFNIKGIFISLLITCLFVEPLSINTIIPSKRVYKHNGVNQELVYEYATDVIGDDKVLCIAQNDHDEFLFVRYLFGEKMNNLVWVDNVNSVDEIIKYKYLYVGIYDSEFEDLLLNNFPDTPIYNETLYSIHFNEENKPEIVLERTFQINE